MSFSEKDGGREGYMPHSSGKEKKMIASDDAKPLQYSNGVRLTGSLSRRDFVK
jgi:hypothetical protein